jgi:hypothetical protein
LKLWGLVSLVNGIIGILNAGLSTASPAPTGAAMHRYVLMTTALGAVLSIVLGAVLLLAASRILTLLGVADDDSASAPLRSYGPAQLQGLVFGGVGVYLAIAALRNIGELVFAIVRLREWASTGQLNYLLETRQEALAGAAVQLVAAVVLLFNRSALASVWSSVRGGGPEVRENVDTAG